MTKPSQARAAFSAESNNPGFVNLSGEGVSPPDYYQLVSGSSAIGIAGTIPSSWTSATGWPGLPTDNSCHQAPTMAAQERRGHRPLTLEHTRPVP